MKSTRRLKVMGILAAIGAVSCLAYPRAGYAAEETKPPIEGGDAPRSPNEDIEPAEYPQGVLFPYYLLDHALTGNVELDGMVKYSELKDNPFLKRFLRAVSAADIKQFPSFDYYDTDPQTGRQTKQRKDRTSELVFWINATNAHILNAIASAYPVKSIDNIKEFDTAQTHMVAGKNYSLKELRAKVAEFGDPRALFATTTGTTGGVLPLATAVRVADYDDYMNAAVRVFVNDPRNVSVNRVQNVVTVNQTFQDVCAVYKVGGRMKDDAIRAVLAAYTTGNGKGYFGSGSYTIEYKKADRLLNDKTSRGTSSQ